MTFDPNNADWRTSSKTDTGGEKCVEVAPTTGGAVIRHSKHPEAGTISFSRKAWALFVREAASGEPSNNGAAVVRRTDNGGAIVRSLRDGLELHFDDGEWWAFTWGARAGEFDFHSSIKVSAGTISSSTADGGLSEPRPASAVDKPPANASATLTRNPAIDGTGDERVAETKRTRSESGNNSTVDE
jgi:uncharacterized protein DUF397